MRKIRKDRFFPLRRRLEQRTNYAKRLSLLKSGEPRLVIRKAENNIRLQLVEYHPEGDKTLVEVYTGALKKLGWNFHGGSLPSAYLTGMLAGQRAVHAGITEAVVDLGLQRVSKGNALLAAAKGAQDAGLQLNLGEEKLPDEKRIRGEHIAAYGKLLKAKGNYGKQFNRYDPETLPQKFDEFKSKLLAMTKVVVKA